MGDYRNWYETNFKYVKNKKARSSFLKAFITHFARITDLVLSWRRCLSYRNQSIDLPSKLIDWFLYDRDLQKKYLGLVIHLWWRVFISKIYYLKNLHHRCSTGSKLVHDGDSYQIETSSLIVTKRLHHRWLKGSEIRLHFN